MNDRKKNMELTEEELKELENSDLDSEELKKTSGGLNPFGQTSRVPTKGIDGKLRENG